MLIMRIAYILLWIGSVGVSFWFGRNFTYKRGALASAIQFSMIFVCFVMQMLWMHEKFNTVICALYLCLVGHNYMRCCNLIAKEKL